ncbi:MAG: TIGR00730 family Rossman fold protein [Polyangiaceae bacterium]|nr:TIGR00730 family Rossman fold protein [Polyangiaceae bacterium]
MRVAVYCGARTGHDPRHSAAAAAFGNALAEQAFGLVYGAGSVGLMGILANAVLGGGGEVIGVIPETLATVELLHPGLTQTHVVADMHARKALMAALADAFVALPGGYGTLEELFEVVTWAQLGLHHKPVYVLDVAGYYAPLAALLDHMVVGGFVTPEKRGVVRLVPAVDALMAALVADEVRSPIHSSTGTGRVE